MGRKKLYASATERKRAQRARESAARAHQLDARPPVVALVDHADPVGALAEWSRTTLIVPPGHPRSGEPMALPEFAVDWLRASWDAHEAALSTARKSGKSAIAAVLAPAAASWPGAGRLRVSAKRRRASYGGKSARLPKRRILTSESGARHIRA